MVIILRLGLAGCVARSVDLGNYHKFLYGKSDGKNHLGDLGKDGIIILKWIMHNYDVNWRGSG
jgi:hypothetical protein